MAYISNIPQPTDLFSQSQSQILGNFGAIQTLIDVNHVDFADATNQGKHNFVSFYPQVSTPTLNNTTDVIAYGMVSTLTSQNEMFISKVNQVTVTQICATGSVLSTNSSPGTASAGWTYLPSGILMKWGTGTVTSTSGSPIQLFVLPTAGNIPAFSQVFSAQVTTYNNALFVDPNQFVTLSGWNTTT